MAWCKQQALGWANVDRNFTSRKIRWLSIEYVETTKTNLRRFPPKLQYKFECEMFKLYIFDISTWQLWQLKFPARPENRCVWWQGAFIALITSNCKCKHTRKTLTDFGLIWISSGYLVPHSKNFVRWREKWHAIVQSRVVLWLTRWRPSQWSQLNAGFFSKKNSIRVLKYIFAQQCQMKRSL